MTETTTTAPRPRGGRLPRSARRAQLLEAAREIFVDNGYHAAAMDDIAERAGVSKPVLYQHFPGKLELYLALLDAACDTVVDAVREALASTEDNKARVQATIDVFYSYVASDQAAFRLVFESDITNDPEVRRRVDRVNSETASAIAVVIHEDTALPEVAAELLAMSLVGMAHVGARYWLDQGSAMTKEQAVAMVSTLSWRGIGGFPRTDEPEDA
ncbi:TetR/AcrR family transcriptional regulator [Mumia zhuanghuii]|uniref:TetR/AcrR family transcriptional regulator n=2 Tax=Mumia TaxID=1546255 RepID=A0ABW1QFZ3_9ACTN|nr:MULTISPECIES: TetR/AcrR family transcriptional regulator [Mumia]KAA1422613.1 TetR/AcrR family transcriptional regulator [Mumia zhuanghuii]